MSSSSSSPYNPFPYPTPPTVSCDPECPCPDGGTSSTMPASSTNSAGAHDFSSFQSGGNNQSSAGSAGQTRNASAFPIRYLNGEVRLISADLQTTNFGETWGHVRSWSNQLNVQDQGVFGNGWFTDLAPVLSNANADPANPNHASIALIGVVNETLWFDYSAGPPEEYIPRYLIKDTLVYDSGALEFVHTDTQGRVTRFHDFTVTPELQGKFKSFKGRFGHERTAAYDEFGRIVSIEQTASGAGTCGYYYAYHYGRGERRPGVFRHLRRE